MTDDSNDDSRGFRAFMHTAELVQRISSPLGKNFTLITPAVEAIKRISSIPFDANMIAPLKPIVDAMRPWQEIMRTTELHDGVYGVAREIAKFTEFYQQLPERSRQAYAVMAEHGWYMDGEQMSLDEPMELAEALRDDPISAHETLSKHFEERLDGIEMELTTRHPLRAAIFSDALAAHREGKFTLSIPALLAQADGICQEVLGLQLYSREKKTGQTRIARDIDVMKLDDYTAALLSPLKLASPLVANRKERTPGDGTLNRHAVVHGESADYGTKLNSLRTISLVSYVSWAFEIVKEAKRTES